jgi:hypothetical protein
MQAFSHMAGDLAVCIEVEKLAKVGKTENDPRLTWSRSLLL